MLLSYPFQVSRFLDRLFKRPLERIHAFEQPFEQPRNMYVPILKSGGMWYESQYPLRVVCLSITVDCCWRDCCLLIIIIIALDHIHMYVSTKSRKRSLRLVLYVHTYISVLFKIFPNFGTQESVAARSFLLCAHTDLIFKICYIYARLLCLKSPILEKL